MIHDPKSIEQGSDLLFELEEILKAAGLWSAVTPSQEALASQQPFACDTLAFEQWLQFIFIPRLQALLKTNTLPPPMQIQPMAEVIWQGKHLLVQRVLARFDSWSQCQHG
ncbi:pseudouridine synthase [Alteromonas alba]|uniref:Pseudouridine synthase n=1 Tax=Alteromonas alba TaxID=2079529 RepID=A0A2S9V972_9ALTE|nr:YqcC family protein [Alteromonas alba]PRO73011.1 pseudouridine synthase [Alteromonas alba]